MPESLRVLQEGVADFATIDRILVDAAGFRLGPFGLLDLVGLAGLGGCQRLAEPDLDTCLLQHGFERVLGHMRLD